jgi:hypothetical protein
VKRSPLRRKTRLRSGKPLKRGTTLKARGEAGRKRRARYQAYLKSGAWQRLRLEIIARALGRCESCKIEIAYQVKIYDPASGEYHWGRWQPLENARVHHLRYTRIFHERPSDLQALCRRCHDRIHAGELKRQRFA